MFPLGNVVFFSLNCCLVILFQFCYGNRFLWVLQFEWNSTAPWHIVETCSVLLTKHIIIFPSNFFWHLCSKDQFVVNKFILVRINRRAVKQAQGLNERAPRSSFSLFAPTSRPTVEHTHFPIQKVPGKLYLGWSEKHTIDLHLMLTLIFPSTPFPQYTLPL